MKVVFALYILVTVPILALLLFFLVTRLPGIVAVASDSLLIQARGFSYALNSGELSGMVLSGVQAFVIMLQMLGIFYLLYSLGRTLIVAIWRKSAGRIARSRR